ncbi:MAG: tetratricopeptide repeat protein [Myxococcota bacterium]
MGDPIRFELCARRPEDLATLEILACALEEAGASTRLVMCPESSVGQGPVHPRRAPEPCQVRVGIADPATQAPVATAGARAVALIEDRIEASTTSGSAPDMEQADLVLVAGPARERELSARLETTVRACGLARLDRLGETCSPLAAPELLMPGPALPRCLDALLALHREVASQREPDGDATFFAEVEAAVAFGDPEGAIRKLQAHLLRTDSIAGRQLLARIERGQGRSERAARALECADRMAREALASVACDRGRLQVDQGQLDEARACFLEALDLAPESADGHLGLGSLLLHAGRAGDAQREFQAALDRAPDAAAWSGLGLALQAQESHVEALEAFERALDLDPELPAALFGTVQAGFAAGRLEPASRRLERFLERHPGNLDLTFTLAGIWKELGDAEGALRLLDRIETFDASYRGAADLRRKLEGTRVA